MKDYPVYQELKDAITFIKNKGFGYIKIELEGYLQRRDDTASNCRHGCRQGMRLCTNCDGFGNIDQPDGSVALGKCPCKSGMVKCEHSGKKFQSDSVCQSFIDDQLSASDKRRIIFRRFYTDASVDAELTATVKIEDVDVLPKLIQAFKKLAEANGGGLSTTGAGMHTALLPTGSGGLYPSSIDYYPSGMANFKSNMDKLMPALFFLGSADWRSRSMNYRMPTVSTSNKYSAISVRQGAVEYRVFETCYDRPERVYDFVEVIARSLEYWGPTPGISLNHLRYEIEVKRGYTIARMFDTPEALRALNATIDYLRPKSKTFAQLKQERSFKMDNRRLAKMEIRRKEKEKHDIEQFKRSLKLIAQAQGVRQQDVLRGRWGTNRFTKKLYEDLRGDNKEATISA